MILNEYIQVQFYYCIYITIPYRPSFKKQITFYYESLMMMRLEKFLLVLSRLNSDLQN